MYNHQEIEKKWQNYWYSKDIFKTSNTSLKPKYYVLDMFPYPSGAGLHVGHPEGYTANDIVARYKHARGHNVLHPMGWDAFGLPAENYAIKTGTHPRITTDENIATFKRQIKELGFSYDWNREIDTTDPAYFKWTQWIFLKLFEAGLAYEQDLPVNWCPALKAVLANEEVVNGRSEIGDHPVERKKLRQWVLGITQYIEDSYDDAGNLIRKGLLNGVDDLDWPEGIKDMQRNWIGRSEGINIDYSIAEVDEKITCYTTRPDTNFGMTFVTLAPEHELIEKYMDDFPNSEEVRNYVDSAKRKSDQDRMIGDRTKTGVFTGYHVVSNLTGEKVPLYVGDFVLAHVGTGALVGVPGHDLRDFEFAQAMGIEIRRVVVAPDGDTSEITGKEQVQEDAGTMVNSDFLDGMEIMAAKEKIMDHFEEKGQGKRVVNYKLRDWLFSRQRYWGEPIPLIHLDEEDLAHLPTEPSSDAWVKDGDILMIGEKEYSKIYDGLYTKIVCDHDLPLKLPEVEKYEPSGDGQSPLANIDEFINVQLADNLSGKRETNTMPQWGGSCWYYLRFMDVKNPDDLVGKEIEKYWGNVDSYVGGAEHAVLHLLYARFWHKFLFDIGVVSTQEPFYKLRNQGMILGMSYRTSDGRLVANDLVREEGERFFHSESGEELEKIPAKMSKSLKNVINPDDIVQQYGADTLRMYEMYMADFKDAAPWDPSSIVGVRRFLDRFYTLIMGETNRPAKSDDEAMKMLHKTIKKIGEDIENYKFNTAIAQLMILLNTGEPQDSEKNIEWRKAFIQLLHPFAPHMAEECWEKLGVKEETYSKIYFATNNTSKIERAQKLFSRIDQSIKIEKYSDIIDVEETAQTSLECALQKLEVYKGKNIDAPIAVADTSVHFENAHFDFEPTKVKRTALELAGKKESDLSVEEVAELMIAFYQEKAHEAGGTLNYYYIDSWAVLYPNGEIKTYEYRREYILTDQREGELKPYFPMANLYISKYTGKRHHEANEEDFFIEFAGQTEALRELFGFRGDSVFFTDWPEYDEAMTIDSEITIGVQVLGKLRGEIQISKDEDKDTVLEKAKTNENVAKWLEGKDLVKEIYVPGKIVNLVVK